MSVPYPSNREFNVVTQSCWKTSTETLHKQCLDENRKNTATKNRTMFAAFASTRFRVWVNLFMLSPFHLCNEGNYGLLYRVMLFIGLISHPVEVRTCTAFNDVVNSFFLLKFFVQGSIPLVDSHSVLIKLGCGRGRVGEHPSSPRCAGDVDFMLIWCLELRTFN